MRKRQRDSLPRSAMRLLCTLLGIILGLMLAVSCIFGYCMNHIGTNIQSSDTLPVFSLTSVLEGAEKATALSLNTRDSRIVNILLIGQDRREGETQARSDSMILCTFDRDADKLTLTSFLRDLYLPIPGHGSNRINAAYSFGGMTLLEQTLEENFDLVVDGAIEVDFQQFSQIIDLLGGVTMELRQDEADTINRETGSNLSEGAQLLTGQQTLTYSRIRSLDPDGDISRTGRQRKIMGALVESFRGASPSTLLTLVKQLLPMISTDLNNGQLLMLALEIAPQMAELQITSQRIPADGTFTDKTIDGMRVLSADLDAAKKLLQDTTN